MSIISGVGAGLGGAGDSGGVLGSFYGHTLDQSVRFNDNDSAYLNRTLASDGNRKTWTLSLWIKRSNIGEITGQEIPIFSAGTSGTSWAIFFTADDELFIQSRSSSSNQFVQKTSELFRDPSAWFHIVYAFDTTQATDTNKSKLYVNGEQLTLIQHTSNPLYPSEDTNYHVNNSSLTHFIGYGATHNEYLDGYLAEVNFIDGAQYDASYFGETKDGVWIPKEYSGSYGTNGFHLPMSQTKDAGFSALFDTRDTSTMTHSDSSAYDIGSSDDFTIEFFFNTPDVGANYGNIMGQYATSGPHHLISYDFRSSTRTITWYTGNGAAFQWDVSGDVTLVANKWHHIAFQRDGTTLRAYIDGTRLTSISDAAGNTGYSLSSGKSTNFNKSYNLSSIKIGDPHGQGFTGYISNVRYVIGATIYANDDSNITVPTATLTAVTGTKLLSCVNGTVGDDISSENNDASVTSVTASTVNPFGTFNFFQDASGNSNHFSRSSLFDTDVVPDSPTNNFATMNPIYHSGAQGTLSEGNLKVSTGGFVNTANGYGAVSTFAIPKDKKIYIEVECTDQAGNYWMAGFATKSGLESGPSSTTVGGSNAITMYNRSVMLNGSENDYGSSSGLGGFGISKFSAGDILGMAIDGATGKVWFSRNGTYFGAPQGHQSGAGSTGDPAAGSNEIGTITGGTTEDVFVIASAHGSTNNLFINFGQDSQNVASAQSDGEGIGTFEYAPPTGYVSLCAANLTTPAIGPTKSSQADDHFDTVLFSGTGANQTVTGFNFQPDFVWNKTRNQSRHHTINDSVRGGAHLKPSNSDGEGASTISAYNSDGYDWTYNSSNVWYDSSATVVSWAWKAGGSTSSISADSVSSGVPTLASTVSVNTTAGFSIVTYTGNLGSAGTASVGHGLGVRPNLIISKSRNVSGGDAGNWAIWHDGLTTDNYILRFDTAAESDKSGNGNMASLFTANTFGTNYTTGSNVTGNNYVAYVFTEILGYSKFGSYKGNGSADGTFVFTGFRPAWVVVKCSSSSQGGNANWRIQDSKRLGYNPEGKELYADLTNTEASNAFDILSNGFKIRNTSSGYNSSGATYIYLAFAEAPFKFANSR